MTVPTDKAERELAADLRAISGNPRHYLLPMRFRALRDRGLVKYTEEPRGPREEGRRQRAPEPRAKALTDKGRLVLNLWDRAQEERRAIAGITAARHGALP